MQNKMQRKNKSTSRIRKLHPRDVTGRATIAKDIVNQRQIAIASKNKSTWMIKKLHLHDVSWRATIDKYIVKHTQIAIASFTANLPAQKMLQCKKSCNAKTTSPLFFCTSMLPCHQQQTRANDKQQVTITNNDKQQQTRNNSKEQQTTNNHEQQRTTTNN